MLTTASSERGKRLLNPGEICGELAVSRSTIYRLVAGGQIQAVRVGGQLRFEPAAVADFVERSRTESARA